MSLLIDASLAQLEREMLETAVLGLKERLGTLADLAALRAIHAKGESGTPRFREYDLYYVTSAANVFWWKQASALADDNANVIKPVDVSSTGRWVKASSQVIYAGDNIAQIATGLVKDVILHNGDFSEEVLKSRIFGQAPCIAIHFASEQHIPISQISGALYDYKVEFEIWSVARNYRSGPEAAIGSDVPGEDVAIGALNLHGMAKKLYAGQRIGESGVKLINPTDGRLEIADEAERCFVMALGLTIFASIHNPDAAKELRAIDRIDIQRNITEAPAEGYDELNMVTLGLDVPLGTGYTKTIAAGSAVIGGAAVSVLAAVHTFSSTLDTYRDLTPLGAWVFVEVPRGAAPSEPAAGNLRVGLTVPDAAGVCFDTYRCSVKIPFGAPDQLPLT